MRNMFYNMTGGQALMLLVSVLATLATILVFFLISDRVSQLIIVALIAVVLWLSAHVALPPEAHRMRTIRYAVGMFGGLLFAIAGLRPYIDGLIEIALSEINPDWAERVTSVSASFPITLVLLAAVAMFALLLWYLRDTPPLGVPRKDPLIREASYRERREAFVSVLKLHLQRIDEELRWHHRDFVSLKAEVDVRNTNSAIRRISDLLQALKLDQSADIFVVVGVPGAGKSVALRKCCMELLEQQRPNERIPIYVNLKEWLPNREWTSDKPPTDKDFANFVRRNVQDRLPDRTRAFFDEHFNRLVDTGEIFFMFDSFDEIPGVLDVDESSKLVDAVSAVIVRYLHEQSNGRGIIASRYYRRPRMGQGVHVQLDVRPFSERQIAEVISKSANRADELKDLLFKSRPDLGSLARNPFTLSLILLYWDTEMRAPANQSMLFSVYIDKSLYDAKETLKDLGLNAGTLREAMAQVSWAMFEGKSRGLEMTMGELRSALGRDDMDHIVDALVAARLARRAPRTQAVSFVHRRFNEYFLIAEWLSGQRIPPFDAIPNDNRYRDALVLYAEVAEDQEAKRLAEYCWEEVSYERPDEPATPPQTTLREIYCIRFLTEAFRTRHKPINAFRQSMGKHISSIVSTTKDILNCKIAVETVGLLNPADTEIVLRSALRTGNQWISETAFSSCRYLSSISEKAEDAIFQDLLRKPQYWFLIPDRDFLFALGVADALSGLKARFSAIRAEIIFSTSLGLLFLFTFYFIVGDIAIILLFTFLFFVSFMKFISFILSSPDSYLRSRLTSNIFINHFKYSIFDIYDLIIFSIRIFPFAVFFIFISDLIHSAFENNNSIYFDSKFFIITSIFIISYVLGHILIYYYYGLLSHIYKLLKLRTLIKREFLLTTLGGLISVTLILVAIYYFEDYVFYLFIPIYVLGGGFIIWNISKNIFDKFQRQRRDQGRLGALPTKLNGSRTIISDIFLGFETAKARLQFVRKLEVDLMDSAAQLILSDINKNPWPEGQRPNIQNDEASTRLAKLDARWLGLDV